MGRALSQVEFAFFSSPSRVSVPGPPMPTVIPPPPVAAAAASTTPASARIVAS